MKKTVSQVFTHDNRDFSIVEGDDQRGTRSLTFCLKDETSPITDLSPSIGHLDVYSKRGELNLALLSGFAKYDDEDNYSTQPDEENFRLTKCDYFCFVFGIAVRI